MNLLMPILLWLLNMLISIAKKVIMKTRKMRGNKEVSIQKRANVN